MATAFVLLPAGAGIGKIALEQGPRSEARIRIRAREQSAEAGVRDDHRVRDRIRQELGEPHVDVLWRLSTPAWARARRRAMLPRGFRVANLVDAAILWSSALGMTFVAAAALWQV
ncbi:MAG: hypothetical protein ABIS17_10990 [Casimicrobiaceae bacterium]